MDAGLFGVPDGLPRLVDVVGHGAGQGGDDGPLDFFGDVGDRLEVARGAGGEAGLDDVHPHLLKLAGDFHFLVAGHADAGGLFSIPESGVQKEDFVVSHFYSLPSLMCSDLRGRDGPWVYWSREGCSRVT